MKNLLIISFFLTPLFIKAQSTMQVVPNTTSASRKTIYTQTGADAKFTTVVSQSKIDVSQDARMKSLEDRMLSSEIRIKNLEDSVFKLKKALSDSMSTLRKSLLIADSKSFKKNADGTTGVNFDTVTSVANTLTKNFNGLLVLKADSSVVATMGRIVSNIQVDLGNYKSISDKNTIAVAGLTQSRDAATLDIDRLKIWKTKMSATVFPQ